MESLGGEDSGQSILTQILSNINIGSVLTFAGAAIAGILVLNLKSDTISALDKEIEKKKMEEEAEKAKSDIDKVTDEYTDHLESVVDEGKGKADLKIENLNNKSSEVLNSINELKESNADVLKFANSNESEDETDDTEDDDKKAKEEENKVKQESDRQNSEIDSKGAEFGKNIQEGTNNADKQMFGDRATSAMSPTQPSHTDNEKADIDGNKVVIKEVEKLILPSGVSNIKFNATLPIDRKPIGSVKQTINTKNRVKINTNEEEKKEITKAFEYIVKANPELKYNIVKNVDDNTIKLVAEMDKNTNKRIDELAELLNDKIEGLASGVSSEMQNDIDITDIKNTINKLTNVCNTILQKLGA